MTDPTTKSWERQKGETAKAYASFCFYRDAGADRTVVAAYRTVYGRPNAKTPAGWFNAWPGKYKWSDRVFAYEGHMQAIELNERQKTLQIKSLEWAEKEQESREQIFTTAQKMIDRAEAILAVPLFKKEVVQTDDGVTHHIYPTDKWSLRDVRGLVMDGTKLIRLMADMPTDIIKHQYEINWEALTDEQESRIAAGEDPMNVAPEHVTFVQ